jgi:hypothetical protein
MINGSTILATVPEGLRTELLAAYTEIVRNFLEERWEPAELNGGKICEIVYSIIHGYLTAAFPAKAYKPPDMVGACRALENIKPNPSRIGDRSLRILIPRLLPFLYEIRNNRGVGHVGGDVSPNHEDAEAVLAMASWTLAELVRVFHGVSLAEAQAAVDALVQRRHPLIWSPSAAVKRVLDPAMKKSDQTLVLLYGETDWTSVASLFTWVEYSSLPMFKTKILKALHAKREIEFDSAAALVRITPLGVSLVEKSLLKPVSV